MLWSFFKVNTEMCETQFFLTILRILLLHKVASMYLMVLCLHHNDTVINWSQIMGGKWYCIYFLSFKKWIVAFFLLTHANSFWVSAFTAVASFIWDNTFHNKKKFCSCQFPILANSDHTVAFHSYVESVDWVLQTHHTALPSRTKLIKNVYAVQHP